MLDCSNAQIEPPVPQLPSPKVAQGSGARLWRLALGFSIIKCAAAYLYGVEDLKLYGVITLAAYKAAEAASAYIDKQQQVMLLFESKSS